MRYACDMVGIREDVKLTETGDKEVCETFNVMLIKKDMKMYKMI